MAWCCCCCRPLQASSSSRSAALLKRCPLFPDISPAELDALWREPPYTLTGTNEHFPGNDILTTGAEGEEEELGVESGDGEPNSYWKKEAFASGSTVSLAVGERFSSDVVLVFRGRRRSGVIPDCELQEALRTRLRVVESNSQDVIQLFKDLSARLLSVHAEKDSFVITFKTVEEIWKFSTYLALGYVARCLENFLCDQSFWLDIELLKDLEITVTVDEEHLATLYLGLLLQEGLFFAKALVNSGEYSDEEDELCFRRDDLLMVKDTGQESNWEGTLLSSGQHGLVPVNTMQPLPYPFYQWFLRKYPGCAGGSPPEPGQFEHPIVTGSCEAIVDYHPEGQEELQLSLGDVVEIRGVLLRGLVLFIGTHSSTGHTGFVHKAHVKPLNAEPLDGQLVFLSKEERASLSQVNPCSSEPSDSGLLERLFSSDISTVYRLDRLDESDFTYIRNQPKQEHKPPVSARQSIISEKSDTTPPYHSSPRPSLSRSSPRLSFFASQNALGRGGEGELLSFSLDDTFREMDEFQEDPPPFPEEGSWEVEESEVFDPTLTLLNTPHFQEDFLPLYDQHHSFLWQTFAGQSEDELPGHLESVREGAKRMGMAWAHRRACFLLGRLCAKKLKYSQARVYYEEALGVSVDAFSDLPFLIALYTNLTSVYLKQKMADKLPLTLEKACALLLCLPSHDFTSLDEFELLKLVLRRSVVAGDKHLEARTCYLTASLFLLLRKTEDALPFVERLQFLTISLSAEEGRPIAPLDLNWLLSRLYHRKYMPFLALASLSLDSGQDHSLQEAFQRVELFRKNSERLNPRWREGTFLLPAQIVVYLKQALAIAEREEDLRTQRDLCLGLACVYQQHGALDKALPCAQQAVETGGGINKEEGFEASVMLGWLLVLLGQPERALATLQPLLQSLQGTDSPTQRGVIHNLLALCLRRQNHVSEACCQLHHALTISRESGNQRNQALALANLGCLVLDVGASALAERFLIRSLRLFLEIWESPVDEEHVQTYLWLGRSYKDRGRSQDVRLCYEMGLLISLHARNLHSQMVVAKVLSRHYADKLLYGQSILYYEHCVSVSRDLKDKRLEGEYLEILSSLYLSLNTEKSSRKSLDYSKQSLRISIDLGKREEESETWLQVGRIYYLIYEDELADMYLQAAVKTALRMNDPRFAMSIYEEAGDVFFKGHRNRLASLPFFRDGSLPFARSIRDVPSEFRLLSKLTELLMSQEEHDEALQYALLAVEVSSKTGVRVNEWVAYHRLATVYHSLEQYEMAEHHYLKALFLSPAVQQHPLEARYYTKVYCRLGDLTLHKLKDAYDAVGYFQLALAAALEDCANPQALYVVYMKLAEIHANHMPDPLLCQAYQDSARSLRRELSGLGEKEEGMGVDGHTERGGEMEERQEMVQGTQPCDLDLGTRDPHMKKERTEPETGCFESEDTSYNGAKDMDCTEHLRVELEHAGLEGVKGRETEQRTGQGDTERGEAETGCDASNHAEERGEAETGCDASNHAEEREEAETGCDASNHAEAKSKDTNCLDSCYPNTDLHEADSTVVFKQDSSTRQLNMDNILKEDSHPDQDTHSHETNPCQADVEPAEKVHSTTPTVLDWAIREHLDHIGRTGMPCDPNNTEALPTDTVTKHRHSTLTDTDTPYKDSPADTSQTDTDTSPKDTDTDAESPHKDVPTDFTYTDTIPKDNPTTERGTETLPPDADGSQSIKMERIHSATDTDRDEDNCSVHTLTDALHEGSTTPKDTPSDKDVRHIECVQ
ncbi:SH3 domain and tetratricopeptide repeat-containing protein 2 isoform X3 [Esox lucius]|uniref:SH3 domain and tetratricopeptide repeat-containing protein 2 isoform X3 n=1 Tax=Esox lucius TaxID=8010 RepID=UPI001476B3D3|nr:SH3 domain and tetratricopeptide repeat-containing protein 2 isoform X3 [Esox lucius]